MNEIICTTQAELDAVPVDYDGRVIVKFGTTYNRAKIKQRFKYPAENQTHNGLHLRTRDKRQRNIQKVIEALAMPVIAKSRDTGEELFFTSMREAERKGFDSGKISMCCAGKRASHKNYTWRKAK